MFERGVKVALLQSRAPDIAVLLVRHNLIKRLRGMGPVRMIDWIRRDPDDFFALFLFPRGIRSALIPMRRGSTYERNSGLPRQALGQP